MDNANSKEMGVTRASWCDFIVYTKKGISVERIAFDPAYWAELRQKLASYLVQQNQTGNPTRLRKSYNLFQYIIIRSKEKNKIHLRN